MPCLGQCLNLGTVSNDKDCRHCGATGHTVSLDWHVACTLQIVNVRTQAVGEAEVRGT
jgi:succinate dehydrogenase/fumarate reductase-like Fe-S protein